MSGMVFVTLLCCRLLRYVVTIGGVNVFHVCLNFGVQRCFCPLVDCCL